MGQKIGRRPQTQLCGDALGLCPLPLKPNGCGITGLAVHGARSWRHVGMPPYGVRRGCGGKRRSVRAADSRPYGACSTRSVGRGAHTPPNQAAGITGLAVHGVRSWRHVGMPPYGVRRGCCRFIRKRSRPWSGGCVSARFCTVWSHSGRGRIWLILLAIKAAPKPLSMLTTEIPAAQALSMDSSAARPWKEAP